MAPLFKGEAPLTVNTRIFLDGHQDGTIDGPAASVKENATQLESHVEYEAGKLLVNGLDASPMVGR